MKKTLNHPLAMGLCLLFLGLYSCGTRQAEYRTSCPGKPVVITISGNRLTGLEPFKAQLKVKAYQWEEGSLSFDFYARDINEQTVKVICQENGADIRFLQQDQTERVFRLLATEEQLQMAEIK